MPVILLLLKQSHNG